jgi:hypothetical protein
VIIALEPRGNKLEIVESGRCLECRYRLRENSAASGNFEGMYLRLNRITLPQDAQKGRPARPQRARMRGVPLRCVEPLSDARTKLAGFFSILLGKSCDVRLRDRPPRNPVSTDIRFGFIHE